MSQLYLYDNTLTPARWRPLKPSDLSSGEANPGGGWVIATNGDLINPDSATSTQIDENTSTGVITTTITYGGHTYVQTITPSTPSAGVNRKVITGWAKTA